MAIKILKKFYVDWIEKVPSNAYTFSFSKIWPEDLAFDPTCSNFKFGLDFMAIHSLSKFHEDWIKTLPFRV